MDITTWPHTFLNNYLSPFWQILACWGLMLLVLRLGKFGTSFRIYNTLFHELGHAIFALLFSGSTKKIELFSDASGAAYVSSKSRVAEFVVSFMGYPFAAVVGWLMLTQTQRIDTFYLACGTLTVYAVSLVFYVRNQYGVIWLLINMAVVGAAIYFKQYQWAHIYFFVVGSFILMESIWTALVLLYLSAESPASAGDAKDLRDYTYIPAIVWALVFAFITFCFVDLTLQTVIRWNLWL